LKTAKIPKRRPLKNSSEIIIIPPYGSMGYIVYFVFVMAGSIASWRSIGIGSWFANYGMSQSELAPSALLKAVWWDLRLASLVTHFLV